MQYTTKYAQYTTKYALYTTKHNTLCNAVDK